MNSSKVTQEAEPGMSHGAVSSQVHSCPFRHHQGSVGKGLLLVSRPGFLKYRDHLSIAPSGKAMCPLPNTGTLDLADLGDITSTGMALGEGRDLPGFGFLICKQRTSRAPCRPRWDAES